MIEKDKVAKLSFQEEGNFINHYFSHSIFSMTCRERNKYLKSLSRKGLVKLINTQELVIHMYSQREKNILGASVGLLGVKIISDVYSKKENKKVV